MAYSAELELIDQLLGGGTMPLKVLLDLFNSPEHFKKVLGQYLKEEVIVLTEASHELPLWQAEAYLRSATFSEEIKNFHVKLTDKGIKLFC